MKKLAFRVTASFVLATAVMVFSQALVGAIVPEAAAAAPDAEGCKPPLRVTGSVAETAWRLWVAATCPVNSNQYPYVVWENWLEQAQMYPNNPGAGLVVPNSGGVNPTHALHGSPLTFRDGNLPGTPDTGCNAAQDPPSSNPNLVICEEVRINGAGEDYVSGRSLWNRGGQQQIAAAGGVFEFPKPTVEIKADWLQLDSCSSPPVGVHVERIGTNCFALAGMHLISKLKGNWIWATFEPQNSQTNPNRCVTLGCKDPFGSSPVKSNGAPTMRTTALTQLEQQANLAPEWGNYRLDGVQTTFVDDDGKPTLLGNSIIEGENGGVPLNQSSCISCHSVSSIENNGTDGITLLNSNPVGKPQPLPSSAWIRRDFVWTLSEGCPNSPFQQCSGN